MESLQTLKVNPLLKTSHYQFYFSAPERTARRLFSIDRDSWGKRIATFFDFFTEYGAFPDPRFKPVWISLPTPENRPNRPKTAKSAKSATR